MKKILLCAAFIAASFTSIAQVGIGITTPDASAALDITSTTAGLLPPRMTTVERDLINSGAPAEGLTIYNTDTKCLELYNGTDWISVCIPTTQVANGSGGTYTFMSHNLGADTSLDPHTPVKGLNGDYYQWGKNLPDADVDNLIGSTWGDQGVTTANGNWTPAAKGPQDPCPAGYRVPSQTEWAAVSTNNTLSRTGSFDASTSEFGSAVHYTTADTSTKLLTLPATGYRAAANGALNHRGYRGYYWSSTENSSDAYTLYFNSIFVSPAGNFNGTNGFSVRCIAE